MASARAIPVSEIQERVGYDPDMGVLFWKTRPAQRKKVGDLLATRDNGNGYIYTRINRTPVAVHRLAFVVQTGRWPVEVDHVNGLRSDNRWANLREACRSTNEANKPLRANSSSGYKGVSWHKHRQRWRAHITHRGQHFSLGYHDTPEEAHAAYLSAAKAKFGEFARGA